MGVTVPLPFEVFKALYQHLFIGLIEPCQSIMFNPCLVSENLWYWNSILSTLLSLRFGLWYPKSPLRVWDLQKICASPRCRTTSLSSWHHRKQTNICFVVSLVCLQLILQIFRISRVYEPSRTFLWHYKWSAEAAFTWNAVIILMSAFLLKCLLAGLESVLRMTSQDDVTFDRLSSMFSTSQHVLYGGKYFWIDNLSGCSYLHFAISYKFVIFRWPFAAARLPRAARLVSCRLSVIVFIKGEWFYFPNQHLMS